MAIFLTSIGETHDLESFGTPIPDIRIRDHCWMDLNLLGHEFPCTIACMYIILYVCHIKY